MKKLDITFQATITLELNGLTIQPAIWYSPVQNKPFKEFNLMWQELQSKTKKDKVILSQNIVWYQLKDYEVDGVQRQLVCRLATNKDVKNNDRTGRDSEYYKWVMNKKRFHTYVKVTAYKELRKTKGIHHYKK